MSELDLWSIENSYFSRGYSSICGIDEAGRGPIAGRVYAAAVILPPGFKPERLNDSKQLSEKIRLELFEQISQDALSFGIGYAEVEEIERLNIAEATRLAMSRAYSKLEPLPQLALIDGREIEDMPIDEYKCIIKGDAKSASIAAASILAKVSRDRYMEEMAREYPQYMFEVHKGYGTKRHFEKIREFGPCPIHRQSFLGKKNKWT